MTRESRLWLLAAAAVSVVVVVVVLVFGTSFPPSFPAPGENDDLTGVLAYADSEDPHVVHVLDLESGSSIEYRCAYGYCLHHWDASGLLVVHSEPHGDLVLVDPASGSVVPGDPAPRTDRELLTVDPVEGRLVLILGEGSATTVLLDIDVPRDYRLRNSGTSGNEEWAWFIDSEDRLIGLAVDGSSGPWLIAENAQDAAWK